MSDLNAPGVFGGHKAMMRKAWKPGAWTIVLFLAWLVLLAVPIAGLYRLDESAPMAPEIHLPPWMPIYTPII
ncbi:MAG: hypothetical protein JSS56_08730 [Proteobacteria bacterium]|nr:hypothetical protein [Pseudomonadota bacterium]